MCSRIGAIPAVLFLLAACSSGPSAGSLTSGPFDANRMDVHASSAMGAENHPSSKATGPEPGETFASPPARTIPQGTRVPDVRGMDFEDGVKTLRAIGMDFGFVVARTNDSDPWTILEQSPAPGAPPLTTKRVSMVVSMGGEAAGVAGIGGVACKPAEDDIDEPYCQGKILRY